MKLSQLFAGETHTENYTKTQQTTAHNATVQNAALATRQQISALKPGQTISGEIIGKSGNEVQIQLSDDTILNARVDQNINLEVGKSMIFEVKSNGSSLNLSPLYTNVSAGVNVLKALDMAGLPVNETSVGMTEQLMAAGLSINKNMLLQVYREINNLAQGEISDVIHLHKLGMQVNEANLNQMASYRNLTHQLMDGMNTILDQMSGTLDSMMASGDVAGAAKLYQELFMLVQQGEGIAQGETLQLMQGQDSLGAGGEMLAGQEINSLTGGLDSPGGGAQNGVQAQLNGFVQVDAGQLLNGLHQDVSLQGAGSAENASTISAQDITALRAQITQFAQGNLSAGEFFANLQALTAHAVTVPGGAEALQKLFSRADFKELLTDSLKQQWTIAPQDVAEDGKVEELYQRLDSQLKALSQALETVGQRDSQAFQSVQNMSQNLDFMQQINQMYTYVQLPLRLQQGEAHGELYVYANRKRLTENDGAVSALLHLDMEHLGPVDVYVTLQSSKVNTKFYVRDDEMLDFLEAHMDLLTERLAKKGYNCTFSMTTRELGKEETTDGGIEAILSQEKGIVLSQYAFDVRT